jgi:hypothetical protein
LLAAYAGASGSPRKALRDDGFAAIEKEASLSRVYAGQHFRSDENAGERLGSAVADLVVDNFLTLVGDADDY